MHATIVNSSSVQFNQKTMQKILDGVVQRLLKNNTLKNKTKLKKDEVTLVFVSMAQMKRLNHQFRQRNYATDVLSFAPTSSESLGELVFCPAVLKKQAEQNEHSWGHEFCYLLIHGVLHLLGYDHEISPQQEKKMFLLQDRLFSQLTDAKINLKLSHVYRNRAE